MTRVRIRHRTTYEYNTAVCLLPHRLLLRPREGRELRVVSMEVTVTPIATVTWAQDVAGNAVATATFGAMTDRLVIDSAVSLDFEASWWPVFDMAASALFYPFAYASDEWADLGTLAVPQYPDPDGRLRDWARGIMVGASTDTLALLKDVNASVSGSVCYQSRDDEGTQTPLQTLDRGWGSCRDFAVLFVEAVRSLGFGARIVSGYLCDTRQAPLRGAGTTHAWAEVYVPGPGWISFDPTNRQVGGGNLVPVAVGRDIRQVMPVAGSFIGMSDAFRAMSAEVFVTL